MNKEYKKSGILNDGFRPQQGLTIMNNYLALLENLNNEIKGFRPQQGLTIMNYKEGFIKEKLENYCFRPQQGLTIMNPIIFLINSYLLIECFRPQQGLTIMNPYLQNPDKHYLK